MSVFLPLVFLVASPISQVAPIEIGKESNFRLGFDHELKDTNGDPIILDRTEVIFRVTPGGASPPDPIRVLISDPVPVAGQNLTPAAKVLLGTVPVGQYLTSVRVRSTSGMWSEESPAILLEVTAKKPATPTKPVVVGE